MSREVERSREELFQICTRPTELTNEGLRIELTESATGTFFESGSAKMSADAGDLLKTLAQELGKLPNHVAIEGHTDSKPYPRRSR
jgi:chemotaxis protein MotB